MQINKTIPENQNQNFSDDPKTIFYNQLTTVNQDLMRVPFTKEIQQLCPLYGDKYNTSVHERKQIEQVYNLLTESFFNKVENEDKTLFLPNLIISIKDDHNIEYKLTTQEELEIAKNITSASYSFKLRDNALFEDKKPINSDIIEYTIQQYIKYYDPDYVQFKNDSPEKKYSDKVKNLKEIGIYISDNFNSNINENLNTCFEKMNTNEFKMKYPVAVNLLEVVEKLNKIILLPPQPFASSCSGEQIQYGTKKHPFISYGIYKLEKGYNPQIWVFVKNDSNNLSQENSLPKKIEIITVPIQNQKELLEKHKLSFVLPVIPLEENVLHHYYNHPGLKSFCMDFISLFRINIEEDVQNLNKGSGLLEDVNFRKFLFYGLDRNKIAKIGNVNPTINLVSDIAKAAPYSNVYNFSEGHRKNIYEILKDDQILENLDLESLNVSNLIDQFSSKFKEVAKKALKEAYNTFIKKYYDNNSPNEPLIITIRYNSKADLKKLNESIKNLESLCNEEIGQNKIKFKTLKVGIEIDNSDEADIMNLMSDPTFFEPSNYIGFSNQDKDNPVNIFSHFIETIGSEEKIEFDLSNFKIYLETKFQDHNKPDWCKKLIETGGELQILDLTQGTKLKDFFSLPPNTTVEEAQRQLNLTAKQIHFDPINQQGKWLGNHEQINAIMSICLLQADMSNKQKEEVFSYIITILEKKFYKQFLSIPITNVLKYVVFDNIERDLENYTKLFHYVNK